MKSTVLDQLTVREADVAMALLKGMGNTAIAKHLGIKPRTVKEYLNRAYLACGIPRKTNQCKRILLVRKLLNL